nr:family 43 glycosylhydrolase [Lachnospiraceae bacterium]
DKSRHGAMVTLLDKDMLTVIKAPAFIVPTDVYSKGTEYENHGFFEAPSIRKRNGKYYFIYSSEVMHELCYAMSDHPEGPFTYGGVIISNCDIGIDSYKDANLSMAYGANNHGGIEQVGDNWYIFYHRHTNGTWYSRQGCAEPIAFDTDGKIKQVRLSSCGLNGGPLSDTGEYPAYIACHIFNEKHDVYIGDEGAPRIKQNGYESDFGGSFIANIKKGVTIGFRSFSCKNVTGIRLKTRGYFKGDFLVKNKWDGETLGRVSVDYDNVWTAHEGAIDLKDGVQDLYLTFDGDGCGQLNSFEFIKHEA